MPYSYVEPDVYLSHNGVDVFHTYKDGMEPSSYWFTTDPKQADSSHHHGDNGVFDARYFSRVANPQNYSGWRNWWSARHNSEDEAIRALICVEIEAGRLPRVEGCS